MPRVVRGRDWNDCTGKPPVASNRPIPREGSYTPSTHSPGTAERSPSPGLDYDRLETQLKVLAYASRLELLSLLRSPRTLDEIQLTPGASQAGMNPERPISRQGVQNHLDQLEAAGLVRVRPTQRKGKRAMNEYALDHGRLYAIIEEFRLLSTIPSTAAFEPSQTVGLPEARMVVWDPGPKLVLAHGVHEGKAYPLQHTRLRPGRGWVIGRSPEAHVSLAYDPYVSLENAEILKSGSSYRLLDLRTAKNRTYLNWNRLPVGGEAPLKSGDIVGVGRSLLVFREE